LQQKRGRNREGEQEPLFDGEAVKETAEFLVDCTVQNEVDFTAQDEEMEIDEQCKNSCILAICQLSNLFVHGIRNFEFLFKRGVLLYSCSMTIYDVFAVIII